MPRLPILLFGWLAVLVGAAAQDAVETKIRLMAEALRARDAGDVPAAQRALADLIALNPNDPAAQRLRSEIEAQAVAQQFARQQQAAETERAAQEAAAARAAQQAAAAARQAAVAAGAPIAGLAPATTPAMIEVKIPEPGQAPSSRSVDPEQAAAQARVEAARVNALAVSVEAQLALARTWLKEGKPDDALALLESAQGMLPVNAATLRLIDDLNREKANAQYDRAKQRLKRGDLDGAQAALAAHKELAGGARVAGLERQIARAVSRQEARPSADRALTSLLDEADRRHGRPPAPESVRPDASGIAPSASLAVLNRKLEAIVLPAVNFVATDLAQAIAALHAAAAEADQTGLGAKGVNLVVLDPSSRNPPVTLALRNASLKRVLDFVTEGAGYHYEVQADAVVIHPGAESARLMTEFFPLGRAGAQRLMALAGGGGVGTGEAAALRAALQQAGVVFVEGSALAYDGTALVVTHTPRHLGRIREIVGHYREARQVALEARVFESAPGTFEIAGFGANSILPAGAAGPAGLVERAGAILLGAPRLVVLAGSAASMTAAREGSPGGAGRGRVEVRATPTLRADGRIGLDLVAQAVLGESSAETATQVVLDDGATVVLRALGAPREILIFVTARLASDGGVAAK